VDQGEAPPIVVMPPNKRLHLTAAGAQVSGRR
jgi:hypothetical protein